MRSSPSAAVFRGDDRKGGPNVVTQQRLLKVFVELADTLVDDFDVIDFLHARSAGYGIRVSVAEPGSVDVPAFVGTVTLRYSRPIASPSAGPSVVPSASPDGS